MNPALASAWDGNLWPDGRALPWPVASPGALPDVEGVVETVRWRSGALVGWPAHRARLAATLTALGRPLPALDAVPEVASGLVSAGEVEHRVRVTVPFLPDGAFHWAVEVWPVSPALRARREGLGAISVAAPLALTDAPAQYKLVSRLRALAALAARISAESPGAEPLLLDADGSVLEGATWNLFAVVGGRLLTPPATAPLLPGVTRARVLAAARRLPLTVTERPLDRVELGRASEVFATNALLPLAPLCSLDATPLPPPGRWFRALFEVIDADSTP